MICDLTLKACLGNGVLTLPPKEIKRRVASARTRHCAVIVLSFIRQSPSLIRCLLSCS